MTCRSALHIVIFLLLIIIMGSPGTLWADSIRLLGEWRYDMSKSETEDRETKEVTRADTDRFKQTYRLDINKQLFPTISLNGGAQVEDRRFTGTSGQFETDTRFSQVFPYIEAEYRGPLYTFSGGYRERRAKNSGSHVDAEQDFFKSFDLRGEWRPIDLPRLDVSYLSSQTYDEPLTVQNDNQTILLNSKYDYRNFQFLYNYLWNDNLNKLSDTETITNSHNGRIRYAQNYFDGKVSLNAKLQMEKVELSLVGDGERSFDVFPSGSSFYILNSDPDPNNNNPDDYVATPFGNNLNLNSTTILGFGLAFGEAVELNLLKIALSAGLDDGSAIDNSGNWTVYVSEDQLTWSPRAVSSLVYNRGEDLLELRFSPSANHEFVMIVYNPPVPTNQIEPVYVRSIQAFVIQAFFDGSNLVTKTLTGALGIGWQMTDKTNSTYNMNFQQRESNLFDDRQARLTNGISIGHKFNQIFSSTGRLSISNEWQQGKHKSNEYSYSALLTGRYLDTLDQSLIFSGNLAEKEIGNSLTNSIMLRTTAELYRGWNVALSQGYSLTSPVIGADTSSLFFRVKGSFIPHQRYNLSTIYTVSWLRTADQPSTRTETTRINGQLVLRDNLSMSGIIRLKKDEHSADVSWEYHVGWLPLRDGSLQCNLGYSELQDLDGNPLKSFFSRLSWEMTDYATMWLVYNLGTQETDQVIREYNSLQVSMRVYYD